MVGFFYAHFFLGLFEEILWYISVRAKIYERGGFGLGLRN